MCFRKQALDYVNTHHFVRSSREYDDALSSHRTRISPGMASTAHTSFVPFRRAQYCSNLWPVRQPAQVSQTQENWDLAIFGRYINLHKCLADTSTCTNVTNPRKLRLCILQPKEHRGTHLKPLKGHIPPVLKTAIRQAFCVIADSHTKYKPSLFTH